MFEQKAWKVFFRGSVSFTKNGGEMTSAAICKAAHLFEGRGRAVSCKN